ncbi:MAG: serine/threonine protein kinase [Pseudomonadota bacterium]
MTHRAAPGFDQLLPDDILDAVESAGHEATGGLLPLNSYENRVYRIDIFDAPPIVAKFYRNGRWSDEQLREEHAFAQALAAAEIPVVAPLGDNGTLHEHGGFRFALYPCRGGRWPDLDAPDTLRQLGRLVARIHQIGAIHPMPSRPILDSERLGHEPCDYLLEADAVPPTLVDAYESLIDDLLDRVDAQFEAVGRVTEIPIHGELHPGNILEDGEQLHIVDTDDCCIGPAVQDLWMFLSGDEEARSRQLGFLLEGYETFRNFDRRELALVESLRTLRIMHYAAWLHRRRDDPAFIQAFPWFGTERYWNEHILSLREQFAALDEPVITD